MLVYWSLKTFAPNEIARNILETEATETELLSIIEGIDENSFYTLLYDQNGTVEYTDDDLISYLSSNFSEFEIFEETEK